LRTLLIGALAATLVGCSRQPLPQATTDSCTDANGVACFERMAGPPIKLASLRINSAAPYSESAGAWKTEKPSSAHARRGPRLASGAAKSTKIAANVGPPASRIPLPPGSSVAPLKTAGGSAAVDSNAAALAERLTDSANTPPDMIANSRDRPSRAEASARGNAEKTASASASDTDLLVAVLMARPEIASVSDLTGKMIAIDNRYSASNGSVRTAIVAAGAPAVQLSEGQTTAINRLVNGEVPAAVLALVSAAVAEGFPEIAGFKIFHIPLSPHSLKARP
jgi:hypothetical protein